jgi:hypothetical protein
MLPLRIPVLLMSRRGSLRRQPAFSYSNIRLSSVSIARNAARIQCKAYGRIRKSVLWTAEQMEGDVHASFEVKLVSGNIAQTTSSM